MSRRRAQATLVPDRRQVVDAMLLLAASMAALLGFGSTYPGSSFLIVGALGVILGAVVGHVSAAWRLPSVVGVVATIAVFYVFGPPLCLRDAGSPVPGPTAWQTLTDQVLFGWKDLLTTLPPIDGSGPLLTLPFVLGLAAGFLGTRLARVQSGPVWLRVALPVFVPLLLLAAVILLGLGAPYLLIASGAVSSALALAWLVLRSQRTGTEVVGGSGRVTRMAVGAGILALAAGAANPVATWATGGSDEGRVFLRTYVEPPFDVGKYPSPLSAFRRYVRYPENPPKNNLYDKELLRVAGAPAGVRLRIATLDNYDGVVWGASNHAVPGVDTDTYRRVGPTLDNPAIGRRVDVTVTVGEGFAAVWVPLLGALQSIDFTTHSDLFAQEFRYNLEASAGVLPPALREGDEYSFSAVIADDTVAADDEASSAVSSAGQDQAWLDDVVGKWSDPAQTPMERVFSIAQQLRSEGKYSDGVIGRELIYTPGHYVDRLGRNFLNAPQIVGNDEQYAAAMALMANRVGVPARVVLGAVLPDDGVVMGSDVSAWVELRVADGSWRVLPTEAFMSDQKPADEKTKQPQQQSGVVIPPPAQVPPPSTLGEQADTEIVPRAIKPGASKKAAGKAVPGWVRAVLVYAGGPLLALLVVAVSIVGLKLLRRRRRRSTGATSARIGGGWRELVDHARDLGLAVPTAGVTRREQAELLPSAGAAGLARRADVQVFARHAPGDDAVGAYWDSVASERRALSETVTRGRRVRAAVDPRTLWRR